MVINKELDGDKLAISLEGRLDTLTAPELEKELKDNLADVKNLVVDFKNLEYISSAGLRVLLFAHKQMLNQGSMVIRNVSESVMEVFDVTGFSDLLNIE